MESPPGNEKGALLHAPIPKLLSAQQYHLRSPVQVCFPSWQREAARLLTEYRRPSQQRHLAAFVRYVSAMWSHQTRATR